MPADETKIIYSMRNLNKVYDRKTILKDVNVSYFYGAKIGVLGLNGAGKSTLLKIIAGEDRKFEGEVQMQPGYTVGYLKQEPPLPDDATVEEVVNEAVQGVHDLMDEYNALGDKMGEDLSEKEMEKTLEQFGKLQEELELKGAWELDAKLDMAMGALDCPPRDAKIGPLSGGEKRRVALCALLLKQPDVLLLDEPTNHLDASSVAWLEHHLQEYPGTVIAVTHDRYFLDNVATWMLEIEHTRCIPWKGNYSSWLEQKGKRLAVAEKQDHRLQAQLKREQAWIGTSPAGRQAKNKARIQRFEELYEKAKKPKASEVRLYLAPGPRLGSKVIEARHVSKSYGDKVLLDDVTFSMPPGGIVGVIGPNGAGKTTLMRMIMGQEEPDSGTLEIGETVELAFVEQMREGLKDDENVWQSITDGAETLKIGDLEMNSRAYVARFNFSGPDQQQMVHSLSGGQRNRVNLARMLTREFNVLLLDEPTNDLDVDTIRALEEALDDFPGCCVCVSHDRWFLDRVATHILAFEGEGKVRFFQGNYQQYAAHPDTPKIGADPNQRHKKLVR